MYEVIIHLYVTRSHLHSPFESTIPSPLTTVILNQLIYFPGKYNQRRVNEFVITYEYKFKFKFLFTRIKLMDVSFEIINFEVLIYKIVLDV